METPSSTSRIAIHAANPALVEEVRAQLERLGRSVEIQPLSAEPCAPNSCPLILIEASQAGPEALDLCRRLRTRLGEDFVPILLLTADPSPVTRLAALESGADAYLLRPFAPGELIAQIRALDRIKETHTRLLEKTAEVGRINRRLQQAYQQIDTELALASRIQQSFLPRSLPETPEMRFAVHYHLQGQVGGDFYDGFRLDEEHVGFYVADAVGHGVPASLLTIFVKKGVWTKEIMGKSYRLIPPGEVLERLNRDLIEQRLSESPFITMVYALYNFRKRTLMFARGGHPYPLYLPWQGDPCFWHGEGSLLGVFNAPFPAQTYQLEPGDRVLFYSDGIDGATMPGREPGGDTLLACAASLRHLPLADMVQRLAQELFGAHGPEDDLTFLMLEVGEVARMDSGSPV